MMPSDYLLPGERPGSLARRRAWCTAWADLTPEERKGELEGILLCRLPLSGDPLKEVAAKWAATQSSKVLEMYGWICLTSIPASRQDDLIAALHRQRRISESKEID